MIAHQTTPPAQRLLYTAGCGSKFEPCALAQPEAPPLSANLDVMAACIPHLCSPMAAGAITVGR
jgi:hypothetical protein